jgi:hypothetical protein
MYETADAAKLPAGQYAIVFGKKMRDYLDAKCIPDGPVKAWRIWDADTSAAAESATWQAAVKVKRESLPWIVVSNGKAGFSGPLPADVDAAVKLLDQFAK